MTKEEIKAACDILKYIKDQPGARHTAAGIAKYWIFQQRLQESLETAVKAVKYLIDEGFLQESTRSEDGGFFRVNREKISEIPSTLAELQEQVEQECHV